MGYNNDQFFRVEAAGEVRNGITTNPKFVYPDRTVRTGRSPNGIPQRETLERGYIRSLDVGGEHSMVPRKCQFQFNPQTLTHGVSMNNSMLNHFAQDPGQFAQPMAGEVNFAFSIFFDRSMELNNPTHQTTAGGLAGVGGESPWETAPVSQVGVLKDISALYSVIGQGMSIAQRDYVAAELERTVQLEAIRDSANLDESDSAELQEELSEAIANIPEFLDNNVGNTAFLLPLPVRMVFSSLYMVEGFVTDTDVTFTKFTTNLVPMQCVVRMTLKAQYVGFAKKDTFLTYSLAQRQLVIDAGFEEARQQAEDSYSSLLGDITQASVYAKIDNQLGGSSPVSAENLITDQGTGLPYRLELNFPDATANGDVSSLFDDATSISWRLDLKVYTPLEGSVPLDVTSSLPLSIGEEPAASHFIQSPHLVTREDWTDMLGTYYDNHSVGSYASPKTPRPEATFLAKGLVIYWELVVTVVHSGNTITGRAISSSYEPDLGGSDAIWTDHLSAGLTVNWDLTSDPTDVAENNFTTVPDVPVVTPGTPSTVGNTFF